MELEKKEKKQSFLCRVEVFFPLCFSLLPPSTQIAVIVIQGGYPTSPHPQLDLQFSREISSFVGIESRKAFSSAVSWLILLLSKILHRPSFLLFSR